MRSVNRREGTATTKNGGRITRADVARAAKVSLATVTYALSGTGKIRIGAETCARIRALADRMGYRPNYVHRAIAAGRTYAVGFIVPSRKSLLFPFYEMMIDGCSARMNDADYDPLLLARERWDRVAKVVRDGRVDGLFILQSDFDDRYIRQAVALGLPVVVLNRNLPEGLESDRVACVYSDHRLMMRMVVDEFVGLGCRSILNFSDKASVFANRESVKGLEEAVQAHGGAGVVGETREPLWTTTGPDADALFVNGCPWDGIFVNGSSLVGELLRASAARGFKPGRDYQLITTDAFPESERYEFIVQRKRIERAVYWQQPRAVGETAWSLMMDMLNGTPPVRREVRVPYRREEPDTHENRDMDG